MIFMSCGITTEQVLSVRSNFLELTEQDKKKIWRQVGNARSVDANDAIVAGKTALTCLAGCFAARAIRLVNVLSLEPLLLYCTAPSFV